MMKMLVDWNKGLRLRKKRDCGNKELKCFESEIAGKKLAGGCTVADAFKIRSFPPIFSKLRLI